MAVGGLRLGVDFGTSNTVAVLRDASGDTTALLLFDGTPALPSAVFWAPDGALVGLDAVHSARMRPDRFEPTPKAHIDEGTVLLGEHEVPVSELVAAVLRRVLAEATRVAGRAPDTLTLTHPATWGPRRRDVLVKAAAAAGLPEPTLVPEPVAAARQLLLGRAEPVPVGARLLVYDFGAGTFDASVVRRTGGGFEVVTTGGLADVGGLDIDAAIVAYLGTELAARDPARWRRLTEPQTPEDRRAHRQLWDDVRRAKELLSRASGTHVHVPLFDVDAPVGREQLDALAAPIVRRTVEAVESLLRSVPVAVEELTGIYLVGGASRLPLAATLLHRRFGAAPRVVEQPELVVAQGSVLDDLPTEAAADPVPWSAGADPPDEPVTLADALGPPVPRSRRKRILAGVASAVVFAVAALIGATTPWQAGTFGGPSGGAATPACGQAIAFISSLKDDNFSPLSEPMRKAAQFAVDLHNQAHPGCRVELTVHDSGAGGKAAEAAARQAASNTRVLGVVGPLFTTEMPAAAPVLNSAGLPFLSPSAAESTLRERGWNHYFQLAADEKMQAQAAILYLKSTLPSIDVFIVREDTTYGRSTAAAIRALAGVNIRGERAIEKAQTSFGDEVGAILQSGAKAVFYGGFFPQGGPLLKQLRAAGFTGTFVGVDGLLDDSVAATAGAAAAPAIIAGPRVPATEASDNFAGRFEAAYRVRPESYEGYAYDAANILLAGLAKGISTRPAMRDHVANQQHGGVMAPRYKFDDTGGPDPADVRVARYAIVEGRVEYQGTAKIVSTQPR